MTSTTSVPSAAPPPSAEITPAQAAATMRSKSYLALLAVVAVIGTVVSLIAWGFLELVYQIQQELFTHLPHALGYPSGAPLWWYLPVLALGGLLAAVAIARLPGDGGHLPAKGLAVGGAQPRPIDVPGVALAALATLGFGLVLGPEAPLIAIGGGLAVFTVRLARRPMPPQALMVIAAAGSFAAISMIFNSPLIAAVVLIEATGLGGSRLPVVLVPGLLGAGIGSLVSIGMGSFTGLSTSAYAIGALQLPHFTRPDIAEFGWTIALAVAVAVITRVIMVSGMATYGVVKRRLFVLLPFVGLVVAGLAIAFHGASGKNVEAVLFSGQSALPGLVGQAGTWSLSALALLIVFKGTAYALSMGSFRGGPTFPAMFLGAAGGIMASHLAGYPLTPAVAVGIGAAVVAVLRLPLTSIVLATLLTDRAGTGDEPLIIVGVVVAFVVTLMISDLRRGKPAPDRGAVVEPTAAGVEPTAAVVEPTK